MLGGMPDEYLIVRKSILREFGGLIKLFEYFHQLLVGDQGPNLTVLALNIREECFVGFDFLREGRCHRHCAFRDYPVRRTESP